MRGLRRFEARPNAEDPVSIPAELRNFRHLTFGEPGSAAVDTWRVFLEYEDDVPVIVAVWREGLLNRAAKGANRGRRMLGVPTG